MGFVQPGLGRILSSDSTPWQNPRLARRIPELDGLRGLAILLVVVAHYVAYTIPDASPASWQAYWLALFRLSWSGVDLFFVLSGFLIGGILYDAKQSQNYYRVFYGRRFFRIVPLYFVWFLTFLAGLHFVTAASPRALLAIFSRDIPVWSYPLFIQNFVMVHRQTFGAEWMAPTWSLAVEEQFYLLLPWLIRSLSGRAIAWMGVAAICGAPVLRLVLWASGNPYLAPYTLLPCRADSFGFGLLAALACRNQVAWDWLSAHRRHLYLALFLLGCGVASLAYYDRLLYNIGLSCIDAFYGVLLVLVVVNPGRLETGFFQSRVLMKLGVVSYAVYIFHLGINNLIHFIAGGKAAALVDGTSLLLTLFSVLVVLLLAALSWKVFEGPLTRYAHTILRYGGGVPLK